MSNFFSGFFGKEGSIDFEKRSLYSRLSLLGADVDRGLLSRVLDHKELWGRYRDYQLKALEQAQEVVVTLKDECRLLEDYIGLCREVHGESFFVQISSSLGNGIVFVPPFILFPMVQNAFKNGYSSMEKYPIKIRVQQTERQIQLEVSNRVNHYVANQRDDELVKYYRHRLDELYTGRYELFVNSNSNTFKATLFLNYL